MKKTVYILIPLALILLVAFGLTELRRYEKSLEKFQVVSNDRRSEMKVPIRIDRLEKKEGFLAQRPRTGKVVYHSVRSAGEWLLPGSTFEIRWGQIRVLNQG